MLNWKSVDTIYTYDGTFEGFLTIVFDCYQNKLMPKDIVSVGLNICAQQEIVLYKNEYIETDFNKSYRVFNGIKDNISEDCLNYVYNAFLACDIKKDINIFEYIFYGFKFGPRVNTMLSVDTILYVQKLSRKVMLEVQRMKGFIRFNEIVPELFYSKITPDNNILELLKPHFTHRFKKQNFIIHDTKRNLALLYNTNDSVISEFKNITISKLNSNEIYYQDLWKAFRESISIKERANPRLQKQYMPKRYWENMNEIK